MEKLSIYFRPINTGLFQNKVIKMRSSIILLALALTTSAKEFPWAFSGGVVANEGNPSSFGVSLGGICLIKDEFLFSANLDLHRDGLAGQMDGSWYFRNYGNLPWFAGIGAFINPVPSPFIEFGVAIPGEPLPNGHLKAIVGTRIMQLGIWYDFQIKAPK